VAQTYQLQPVDIGRDISVTVTATRPAYKPGSFTTAAITVAKRASALRAALAKRTVTRSQRALLAVVLKVAGVRSPTGVVKVLDGRRTVAKVKLTASRAGKATVRLPRLKPGAHRITAVYAGTATIAAATSKVVTLTVKK